MAGCADLRPWIEEVFPQWKSDRTAHYRGQAIDYSLYDLLLFPVLLLSAVGLAISDLRARKPAGLVVLMRLYTYLFAKTATCLSDGLEGGRISFSTFPLVLIVGAYVMAKLLKALSELKPTLNPLAR